MVGRMESVRCRLCLKKGVHKKNGCEQKTQTLILDLFSFTVKPDDELRMVCAECFRLMQCFNSFRNTVRQSQLELADERSGDIKDELDKNVKLPEVLKSEFCSVNIKSEPIESDVTEPMEGDVTEAKFSLSFHNYHQSTIPSEDVNASSINNYFARKPKSWDCKKKAPKKKRKKCDSESSSDNEEKSNQPMEFPKEVIRNGKFILIGKPLEDLLEFFYDFDCKQCGDETKFPSILNLFHHLTIFHNVKASVACNLCGDNVCTRRSAKFHMARHLQPSAFECSICKKTCSVPASLSNHMKIHLTEGLAEKPHKCDKCEKSFATPSSLNSHRKAHVDTSKVCEICGKSFPYYSSYIVHQATHSNAQFLCPQCGKKFNSKQRLDAHLTIHDPTGKNKMKCEECGSILKNLMNYKEHMKKHDPYRRVACTECDYSTHSTKLLNMHVKKHLEKEYSCKVCNKKFALQSYVRIHMVQHTGERKYSCNVCFKSFASSGNYYSHRKRMHSQALIKKENVNEGHMEKGDSTVATTITTTTTTITTAVTTSQ